MAAGDAKPEIARPGTPERATASDRPGVAQPVPERPIPARPWGPILLGAVLLAGALLAAWEWQWRAFGVAPGYRNSNGQWAQQRRRIDAGEGDATVLIGSSRVLFDLQLPVWERLTGGRPIQLALEGTSPVPILEDLAADPKFTGRLLIGVAPVLFFSDFSRRVDVLPYYRDQSPSQRAGQWLSMQLEPVLAFYDPDFALSTVVRRQAWPLRAGAPPDVEVRKLSITDADRNTRMWSKVEDDPAYRALTQDIWKRLLTSRPPPPPKVAIALREKQIERAATAIAKLHRRGVPVLFLRPPSAGLWLKIEQQAFPRAETWDRLLARTGAPGIHFEDYPQLQGYELPEWSHLSASEADRFTAALVPIIQREHWGDDRPTRSGPVAGQGDGATR